MEKMTIRLLAKQLNLSIATVSKALNDSYEISPETKKRVLDLVAQHNYVPNLHASSLRKQVSKTIAVVIPEVADSFFSQAINGIESVARAKGYHVLVYLTHESGLQEQMILKDFLSGRVDGVLISVSSETADPTHINQLQQKGIPLVFFDRICDGVSAPKITTDDLKSSYAATTHLIKRGCKKIALLTISNTLAISTERTDGFKQALKENAIPFSESDIVNCNEEKQALAKIKALLRKPQRPDGIVATVEKLASSVYFACADLNINIPSQLKVVAFSNLPISPLLSPALSTVTQPAFRMGEMAATVLFKALQKKPIDNNKESQVVPSELIVRASS